MAMAIGFAIILAWVTAPNAALALATLGKASEDSHLAFGALCFIPWTIFGLYLS